MYRLSIYLSIYIDIKPLINSVFMCVFYSPDPVSYYNPLHIAVLRNRPNMVKLLVGHGANIEKRDRVRKLLNKSNKKVCVTSCYQLVLILV